MTAPVPDVIVTMADARAMGYCARGCRATAARYNLDWLGFARHGLPASTLEATGDAQLIATCQHARQVARHG